MEFSVFAREAAREIKVMITEERICSESIDALLIQMHGKCGAMQDDIRAELIKVLSNDQFDNCYDNNDLHSVIMYLCGGRLELKNRPVKLDEGWRCTDDIEYQMVLETRKRVFGL